MRTNYPESCMRAVLINIHHTCSGCDGSEDE